LSHVSAIGAEKQFAGRQIVSGMSQKFVTGQGSDEPLV
jgi:hypothetical protein